MPNKRNALVYSHCSYIYVPCTLPKIISSSIISKLGRIDFKLIILSSKHSASDASLIFDSQFHVPVLLLLSICSRVGSLTVFWLFRVISSSLISTEMRRLCGRIRCFFNSLHYKNSLSNGPTRRLMVFGPWHLCRLYQQLQRGLLLVTNS